ncbi:Restriction endonuclease type IV Mrr domain-containing protein [Sphingomonas antarctica]
MATGYVIDFSDRTMAQFFEEELDVDIDADVYRDEGDSKAKRLRCFLRKVDNLTAAKTLRALLNYRDISGFKGGGDQTNGLILTLIGRLEGRQSDQPSQPITPVRDRARLGELRDDLLAVWKKQPQERGVAFERFLKRAFDYYGLRARDGFRIRGEQIDGSFDLDGATYLLEAKWEANKTPAADLHTFEGKLSQKASWARGLFVSYVGFTDVGLHAFGRGKRTVCMSGQDFDEMFERIIPLDEIIRRKVRRAAETGDVLVPVRDMFP